jgi:photosystem II stability/assembly factor-like uncharacterized protein
MRLHSILALLTAVLATGCALEGPLRVADGPTPIDCTRFETQSLGVLAKHLGMGTKRLATTLSESGLSRTALCQLDPQQRRTLIAATRGEAKQAAYRGMVEYFEGNQADEFGNIDPNGRAKAIQARRALLPSAAAGAKLAPQDWTSVGPTDIGGRTRHLWIDSANNSRAIAAMASGGLWETVNAGQSWRPLIDTGESMVYSSLTQDAQNRDLLYASTGEFSGGLQGFGVMRSLDRGRTWQHLPGTTPGTVDAIGTPCTPAASTAATSFHYVQRVSAHPTQGNVVLAAARRGVYRSTDGGETWRCTTPYNGDTFQEHLMQDVKFDPANGNNVIATGYYSVAWVSSDAGLTWRRIVIGRNADSSAQTAENFTSQGVSGRAELAWSRSRPQRVYASVDINGGDLYASNDAGLTWAALPSQPRHLNRSSTDAFSEGQGLYDNIIWVSPTDDNHLIVGGIRIFESKNGGGSWVEISQAAIHVDHHAIVSDPGYNGTTNRIVWFGNDGGVYRTSDSLAISGGAEFTNLRPAMTGLVGSQFYRISAQRVGSSVRLLGGLQDNNSILSTNDGRTWDIVWGGDGAFNAINANEPTRNYVSSQYGNIQLVVNDFVTISLCRALVEVSRSCATANTQKTNFITPFTLDPNLQTRMYVGAHSLWMANDVTTAATTSWRAIRPPVTTTPGGAETTTNYINVVEPVRGAVGTVWLGYNAGQIAVTNDAQAATPTWRTVSATLPARRVLSIYVDPADTRRVFATFGGFSRDNVWRSTDGGTTWSSIHGALPLVPIHAFTRHPQNANYYLVGTEVGIFTSTDAGRTWSARNEGPANVFTNQFVWVDDTTVYVSTYGRGVWKATIPANVTTGPANYTDLWWSNENGHGVSMTQKGNTLFAAWYHYDSQGRPTWIVLPSGTWNAAFTEYTGDVYTPRGSFFAQYDVSRLVVGNPVGRVTLRFSGPNTGSLDYTIGGITGSKPLARLAFARPSQTAPGSFADLWYGGPANNGWGVNITQQGGSLFVAWYTYDRSGVATWYVMPSGEWSGRAFTGRVFRVAGAPVLGVPFNAAAVNAIDVGSMTLTFAADSLSSVMQYNVDGASGQYTLTRLAF